MVGKFLGAKLRGWSAIATLLVATVCMVSRGVAAGRPEAMFGGLPAGEATMMEATPGSVAFANVPVGDTYTQMVRLTNVSSGSVTITKISGSQADLGISQIALPMVLEAGSSTTFTISYKPKAAGNI